jgi:ribosomal protein S18 acetylase RimI-like enzyme
MMNNAAGSRSNFTLAASMRFRTVTKEDWPRLILLINAAFAVETFIEGPRIDEERLGVMMETGEVLVGEDEAGRMLCSVYLELRGKRGYLGMLAVDPSHQRLGLARRIIEEAEGRFRRQGCEAAEMTVLTLRPELPPIYRKFGYSETRIEEFKAAHLVKDGRECRCIVMAKRL